MKPRPAALLLSAILLTVAACAFADPEMQGLASWYGGKFHGRLTSSGEVFDTNTMTAAHRQLPFGTMVRVTNLDNGRSAIVKINDRGPFVEGRIIDLSRAAAESLDMLASGVARVSLEIVAFSGDPDVYAIQVGAYGVGANAEKAKQALESAGFLVTIETTGLNVARVMIRDIPAATLAETRRKLEGLGYLQYLVRKEKTEPPVVSAHAVSLPVAATIP
ncbi:MAG TPA: septal ring lytic transglycosylase RlpA family protein [Spirochaetia bacterium]|nr:septal ring lytic transglycosylase RlpA family protein [Spirochaetia bacterium]